MPTHSGSSQYSDQPHIHTCASLLHMFIINIMLTRECFTCASDVELAFWLYLLHQNPNKEEWFNSWEYRMWFMGKYRCWYLFHKARSLTKLGGRCTNPEFRILGSFWACRQSHSFSWHASHHTYSAAKCGYGARPSSRYPMYPSPDTTSSLTPGYSSSAHQEHWAPLSASSTSCGASRGLYVM